MAIALPHFRNFRFFPLPPTQSIEKAQRTIADFVRSYHPSALSVKALYGIDNRHFHEWLTIKAPAAAKVREKFFSFAEDINRSPRDTAARLKAATSGESTEIASYETLMHAAELLAANGNTDAAVDSAKLAFDTAALEGTDEAVRLLPGVIYYAHRYGTPSTVTRIIQRSMLPFIDATDVKDKCPPNYLAAAIGQLACVLNESGQSKKAVELFEHKSVQQLIHENGDLRWCGCSALGNEAHAWLLAQGTVERARDRLEDVQRRYDSSSNQQSLASTQCRLLLAVNRPREAWTHIEPAYRSVRDRLRTQYDPVARELRSKRQTRYLHSLEALLLGIVTRSTLNAAGYGEAELESDLALLEALFAQAPRPSRAGQMHLGYGVPLPIARMPDSLRIRLLTLSNALLTTPLTSGQTDVIGLLADRLRERF